MFKKFGFKVPILSLLLIILLFFGPASNNYAGIEPPPGAKITGKAVDAVLTAVQTQIEEHKLVIAIIVGSCNKVAFAIGPDVSGLITPENIDTLSAEDLEDVLLPGAGPAGCFSEFGGDDLVITRVTSFHNTGTAIGAEISLQVIQ